MKGISCRKAESMITPYITRTLDSDDLEDFLEHVEKCSSCYNELETSFIINEGLRQLDKEDNNFAIDFQDLLKQDILRAHHSIKKHHFMHTAFGVLMLLTAAAFVIFILFALSW